MMDPREGLDLLRQLQIQNYALIESLDLEFGGGLTVLTGETGAGKSIILDAIAMLTGSRAYTRLSRPVLMPHG